MDLIIKVLNIFTLEERKKCIFLLFSMFLGGIFEAVGISTIFPLISILGDAHFLEKYSFIRKSLIYIGISNHISFSLILTCILIIWYIGKNFYMVWLTKRQVAFILEKQVHVAKKLMIYYLENSYLIHLERNSSILLRNLQSSVNDIFSKMFVSLLLLLTEIVIAFAIWLMLVCIDPFTAIVVLGTFAILIWIIVRSIQKKLILQGKVQNQCIGEFTKWLNQGLGGIKETKVLRKEEFFWEKFSLAYEKYGNAQKIYTLTSQLPKFFIEACVTIGLLMLITIKLYLGSMPEKIIPLLGVLSLAAFRLMPCANRIISFWGTIKYYLPTFNGLYEDFMMIKENDLRKNTFESMLLKRQIEFHYAIAVQSLSFRYSKENEMILQNISFFIPKGSFVGIIGQSGSGKTTFVDILLGLLEPTSGEILVDGQDAFRNIHAWQRKLAYVPQNIYLIDGNIRDNIAIGETSETVDDIKLEKVLRMAELYGFVYKLPDGLATPLGEQGVKLSGGQRQRIGIARALYQEPEVLILDEATSALDNETEKNITDTILKLKGSITIIAVAHRMSTLESCDFKVRFKNGQTQIVDKK